MTSASSTTAVSTATPGRRRLAMVLIPFVAVVAVAVVAINVLGAAGGAPRSVAVNTLNDSGVSGTVSFRDVGGRTEVTIDVEPGGNADMPAHIHPGDCTNLTPQPKFPLENVRNGSSVTVVPAPVAELFAGGLAVNIHKSNDDLGTYTACVDLR
jgi:hypothetical protein